MTDDHTDIDPDVAAKVLENAEAFIKADNSVDAIIEWGEREILALDAQVLSGAMKIKEFKKRSEAVHAEVERKLQQFQSGIVEQYATAGA